MPRLPRIAVAVAAALIACLCARVAAADRPVLAVVPFNGPHGRQAEEVVVRTLRRKATLVPASAWKKSAEKLFAHTHSPEDISAVAEDVGAQVVITGIVKRDGRHWQLSVGVRDGKTGKTHDRLRYPLKAPRLDEATLSLLAKEIDDAFDTVAAQPTVDRRAPSVTDRKQPEKTKPEQRTEPAQTNPGPVTPVAATSTQPGGDELAPVKAGGAGATPPTKPNGRPRWAPYFDVDAGALISGRTFEYDPASQPKFTSGVVAGVRGDLTVYPLAFTWRKAGGAFSGLGLGATVDKPFWPDSSSKQDPTQKFPTSELRVEGGLRWRIVLYKPLPRPQLLVQAGAGLHTFSLGKDATGQDVGPADTAYKYATFGAGLRIHFTERVYLWAMFDYHLVFDSGPITNPATEFGPADTFGIRVRGGLAFFVYKGLKLGAEGYYERFSLTFTPGATMPVKVANSATDQYFGGVITVGYVL